jgi:hypothetical protein
MPMLHASHAHVTCHVLSVCTVIFVPGVRDAMLLLILMEVHRVQPCKRFWQG